MSYDNTTRRIHHCIKQQHHPAYLEVGKHIIRITKPNKDINMGASYRPISLLTIIPQALEKKPSSLHHKQYIPHQNTTWFLKTHDAITVIHNINNTIARGFTQMTPPTRIITVALGTKFRYSEHTQTYQNASTYTHPKHQSENTHQRQFKLASLKAASSHPHSSTYTHQTLP